MVTMRLTISAIHMHDGPYVCLCVAKDVYVHVQCTLYVHNMNYMYDDAVDDADDAVQQ